MAISKGKIIRYAVLPEFLPRIKALLSSGFSHIAYLIALIFQTTRLLPREHPYLNPQNIGRYGMRHVIAEAARNLVFSRRNIDQIIVFFAILCGIVLLAAQFVLLAVALLSENAFAFGMTPYVDWFTTPSGNTPYGPDQDIAFIILDRVFGMENIYNSCASIVGANCLDGLGNIASTTVIYPTAFQDGLHGLLEFYSYGMVFVATIIILYFVITIIGETAATGTPFGQRYNKAWVPVRLILFFAMLAPLNLGGQNSGINGAQLIAFHAAKWGSNMATNGWAYFNTVLTAETLLGQRQDLIATPSIPEVGSLTQFFFITRMCQIAEGAVHDIPVNAYLVRDSNPLNPPGPDAVLFSGADFAYAKDFAMNGTITIRFGEYDPAKHNNYKGHVNSFCGEINLQIVGDGEPGALGIMDDYYTFMQVLWADTINTNVAECMLRRILPIDVDPTCGTWPDAAYARAQIQQYEAMLTTMLVTRINDQINLGVFALPPGLLEKGWAGAAIWYNRIAAMNGAVTSAVMNVPKPKIYPYVMEEIVRQKKGRDENISGPERFDPLLADGTLASMQRPGDQYIAAALYAGYNFWETDSYDSTQRTQTTGNIVLDTINAIFGTSGLFDMRNNPNVHPLAQLSAIGKGMIEATVRNVLIATGGAVGDGLADLFGPFFGNLAKAATSFLMAVVQVTLVLGVMLFYVLPFLPFIYFLFAVSAWVKSIFEAIVAMPLWALAHIRIDGEGIPGQGATNGYFLLFEIFLRPLLIVFGLLASISIFSALVLVLNSVFDLVVANMTGYNYRGELSGTLPSNIAFYRAPLDEFFFTAIYAIIAYMLGLSCFKLVDLVPNNILRWVGMTVATFQEGAGDPAGQLTSQVYRGSQVTMNQIGGAISGGEEGGRAGRLVAIMNTGGGG